MVGMPLTMFIIPSCTGLAGLVIVVMIMGLCMGCIDCISNLGMINLFQKNVSPFLQALHFCYGLGAFITPMVAEPFLLNVDCTPYIDGYSTQKTINVSSSIREDITVPPSPTRLATLQHESRLKSAFYIIGTIQLPVTLLVAIVVIKKSQQMSGNFLQRTSAFIRERPISDDNQLPKEGNWFRRHVTGASRQVITITLLASFTMFIFDGLQSSYGGYVYSYSLKSVPNLKQSEGAVLNACFWGTFAAGRLFAILLASKFTAGFMLLWDILGACFSMTLTIILRTNHIGIYVGTCFLGLFLSSASPTVLSLTEQFIDINPSITSALVVFSAIGETLCPVIVGNMFVNLGPTSFLVFCFIIVIISLLLFIALFGVGRETEKYSNVKKESFIWLPGVWRRRAGQSALIDKSTVKYYSRMQESPSIDGSNMELARMDSSERGPDDESSEGYQRQGSGGGSSGVGGPGVVGNAPGVHAGGARGGGVGTSIFG